MGSETIIAGSFWVMDARVWRYRWRFAEAGTLRP
jgi:hypothetical protein